MKEQEAIKRVEDKFAKNNKKLRAAMLITGTAVIEGVSLAGLSFFGATWLLPLAIAAEVTAVAGVADWGIRTGIKNTYRSDIYEIKEKAGDNRLKEQIDNLDPDRFLSAWDSLRQIGALGESLKKNFDGDIYKISGYLQERAVKEGLISKTED